MKRTQIREQIFKLLFRHEFNDVADMPEQIRLFFERPAIEEDENKSKDVTFTDDEEKYILDKYESIVEKIDTIDAMITDTAKGWSAERLGKVDLTVLRLAIYEMKYDEDIPVSVAIDEAVELAKKFGQDESGAFVNGILAKIAKQD
ncbi:MAG: transcription antitermination factor NusB [Lachnospiraceae bacterium]|nr:transcription antitermination factor NusB [Lachnospiraceae bacterium]